MAYIGNPIYQSAFVTDTFSGNGTTTAFTMAVAPAGTTNVLVVVSGVVQDPSTYGVVGNTITFSQAPPTGTNNISCRYLGVPVTGVTTTAYRTVTEFTATASQTTFTPPSYNVGFINVYRNGVLLGSADYTATNGTTVVLATGATAGDLVTTISMLVSSVLNALPQSGGTLSGNLVVTGSETINGNLGIGTSTPNALYIVDIGQPASTGSTCARARIVGTTNQADWYAVNTGGDLYCGVDNSTGSVTGTAYGTYIYTGQSKPISFHTGSTKRMTLQSGGALNITNQPMISAWHTSNDSPAGGSPIVAWTIQVNNGGGTWTAGTGTYTVPVTGNYLITCTLLHSEGTNPAGGIFLKINGSNAGRLFYVGANSGYVTGSASQILSLTSGNTIQFIQENNGVIWYGDSGGLGSFTINMLS